MFVLNFCPAWCLLYSYVNEEKCKRFSYLCVNENILTLTRRLNIVLPFISPWAMLADSTLSKLTRACSLARFTTTLVTRPYRLKCLSICWSFNPLSPPTQMVLMGDTLPNPTWNTNIPTDKLTDWKNLHQHNFPPCDWRINCISNTFLLINSIHCWADRYSEQREPSIRGYWQIVPSHFQS